MGAGCCSLGTGNPPQPDRCPSAPPHPSVASPPRFGDLCTTPGLLWAMGPSCAWCCPVRWLGSITLCDENDTVFLFPDPLVFVGSTELSCPHGCREGSVGARVPWAAHLSGHQGHRNCCPLPGCCDAWRGLVAVGAPSWFHLPRAGLAPKAASWAQESVPLVFTGASLSGLMLQGAGFCSACTSPLFLLYPV